MNIFFEEHRKLIADMLEEGVQLSSSVVTL